MFEFEPILGLFAVVHGLLPWMSMPFGEPRIPCLLRHVRRFEEQSMSQSSPRKHLGVELVGAGWRKTPMPIPQSIPYTRSKPP